MFSETSWLVFVLVFTTTLSAGMFHSQCTNLDDDVGTPCLSTSSCGSDVSACSPCSCGKTGCDVNRWSLVYMHDDKGNAVYGRREHLVAALRDGAALTVHLPSWQYTVQAEHVHFEEHHVCAQFWKHASFSDWMHFQSNVYWWITMVCTSGYGQATRYFIGGNFVSRNDYTLAAHWYIKYPCRLCPVLTLNAAGWIESGTVGALRDAVLAGKAVSVLVGDDDKASLHPLTTVAVKQSQVVAQSVNRLSVKPCKDGRCQFLDSALWLSYLFSTAGGVIVETRRIIDTAARLADVHQQAAVSWIVDDCWTLILVHDGAGRVMQGCLESLRDAVRAGHRVRVRLPGLQHFVAEADGLQINRGVVSGIFLSLMSDNNGALPDVAPAHVTHAVWMTVSTSGVVRMRRQKLGSTEAGKKTTHAFDRIMWFVDTRPWQLTLSVDAKGTVTGGSKMELTQAIKKGASVRYATKVAQDVLLLTSAHNLHLSGSDASAQNILSISLQAATDDPDDIEFQDNPYWFLTIVTTTGNFESSRWTYGKHESRSRDVRHFPVDWFILY